MWRAVGGTLTWLWGGRVQGVAALPEPLHVPPGTSHGHVMIRRLEVEAEAMSRFVQKTAPQQGIRIAMAARSRQVIALHVGHRRRQRAKRLWAKLPEAYRQHATFFTAPYVGSAGVMPSAQPQALSKVARQTHHVERSNNTRRQRVSRVGREALSLSKRRSQQRGAIKRFIWHDNLTRAAAIQRA